MTYKSRTILFIFFILAFCVITPLAIMYAAGYQINLTWPPKIGNTLQKTGALIINSKPEGATVFINGEIKQKFLNKYLLLNNEGFIGTPAKIKNLTPGEYNIKLELNGYWPWQKKLKIEPGQSTFAENIVLFKNELPVVFQAGKIDDALISPDKKNYFIASDKIYIKSLDNDQLISAFALNSLASSTEKDTIAWSPNSQRILYGTNVFSISSQETLDLAKKFKEKIFNLKWSDQSNDLIYIQTAKALYTYNIYDNKISQLLAGEIILDYIVKNDNIIYLSQISHAQKLRTVSTKDKSLINEMEVPFSDTYVFLNQSNKYVNLFNSKQDTLYLIDPLLTTNPIRQILNNIRISYWADDQKLLYANDFEIWLLDLNTNQNNLITRISQSISGLLWHPSNNYIIYSTDKNINIIELDNREKRNSTQISALEEMNNLNMDKDGNIIFFSAKIGNQIGLYKIHIQ